MLKVAQAIWDDFKIKTCDHVAPKYQTSGFPAMVGSNIFLWSWDKILALVVEISNIINTERSEARSWHFCIWIQESGTAETGGVHLHVQ